MLPSESMLDIELIMDSVFIGSTAFVIFLGIYVLVWAIASIVRLFKSLAR
ncbi:unnamed protein product [marine sediment metagenome]|uniref:Uncharacterized protein n=1 Tax=marine sediment metagenome TaxID=412755 RepID=X1H933_9ZZZZ